MNEKEIQKKLEKMRALDEDKHPILKDGDQLYKAPEYLGKSTLLKEPMARKVILGEQI